MAGISAEEHANRVYEISFNYVNRTVGNKQQAYRLYYIEHDLQPPVGHSCITEFFKRDDVKKQIEIFRQENRENYPQMREDNIARLLDIYSSGRNSDKMAAVKELNNMFGFSSQNINLNGKVDSEIEIFID